MKIKLWEILVPAPIFGAYRELPRLGPGPGGSGNYKGVITENDPAGWDKYVSDLIGGLTFLKKTSGQWKNPCTRWHRS